MSATPCPAQGGESVDEITCCRYEGFLKALADETRQAILKLVQAQEMTDAILGSREAT